eukprot:Clim_evm78s157 gene=Clim_evmTU78s157
MLRIVANRAISKAMRSPVPTVMAVRTKVTVKDVNFAEWQSVIDSDKPVVVDFYADSDDFVLAKVDVDENDELAAQYKVAAIPKVLGFWKGKPVGEFAGARDKQYLNQWITALAEASKGGKPDFPSQ